MGVSPPSHSISYSSPLPLAPRGFKYFNLTQGSKPGPPNTPVLGEMRCIITRSIQPRALEASLRLRAAQCIENTLVLGEFRCISIHTVGLNSVDGRWWSELSWWAMIVLNSVDRRWWSKLGCWAMLEPISGQFWPCLDGLIWAEMLTSKR